MPKQVPHDDARLGVSANDVGADLGVDEAGLGPLPSLPTLAGVESPLANKDMDSSVTSEGRISTQSPEDQDTDSSLTSEGRVSTQSLEDQDTDSSF